MNRPWFALLAGLALLQGCASTDREAIPVVDASAPVADSSGRLPARSNGYPTTNQRPQPQVSTTPADSGVVVMVPQGDQPLRVTPSAPQPGWSAPVTQTSPNTGYGYTTPPATGAMAPSTPTNTGYTGTANSGYYSAPAPSYNSTPTPPPVINKAPALAADEQLDGPVLALLTTAQQQQGGGDLNGAASSLERAQRIAPREPQVLYRLAQIRLNQGDAAQAEQLSRRALSYAAGRPTLQASLWDLIAQAREKQGDPAGAAQARQRAKVSL